jgi:hypothetical protein
MSLNDLPEDGLEDQNIYKKRHGANEICTRAVRKVKNVCAYNPRSCFIVPDQSFGVFSRV